MKTYFKLICMTLVSISLWASDSKATQLLKERSKVLTPKITQVSKSVYCATGFSPANISMIIGVSGILIVDSGMFPAHGEAVLKEFRKITKLPIVGVILTHGHGDHTGGIKAFTHEKGKKSEVLIYARSPFNTEGQHFQDGGIKENKIRGARQGGFLLPPNKRINNGIAPAFYPPKEKNVFLGEHIVPSVNFSEGRHEYNVAGIKFELVAAPGETSDQLYCWLPEEKVIFTGDNFYRSWPNTYAIRGTHYRDVKLWIESLTMMIEEKPHHTVPGHTLPLIGVEETTEVLDDYRKAIAFVLDQSVKGINQGMTPDELVQYVKLPKELAEKDHLREYYGNIEWSVRAIFSGYLGWFDGNPTTLFSLSPQKEAQNMARLVGGEEALSLKAHQALQNNEAQWCAQLSDHLIYLNPANKKYLLLKASALDILAEKLITATGRNYYLTVAQELRVKAKQLK
ncbi:alkyl/aryl-sulfatase [Lentisphaera profundi]|uniref:Alkyl/aryl-sulfatase n=1 Tax=Lentisphaera profundi TaxID=1658616 RepID=A0ABY7VUZ6_9BACT|nr:alkyl/aryl-sulfatase [Lentisphaera profundi]WDE98046.1 alkyl/aryl-sulfatase [Lentisphaera profundi]